MRLLIHSINFSPETIGVGKYTSEMVDWLVSHGYEVRVVTAPPYYPQWKIADGFANGWQKEGGGKSASCTCGGSLVVYRCPLWIPSVPSGLKRIFHLASFALSSFPVMLQQIFWRPDVVFVIEPPLFCAPQAKLVAWLSGGKSWLHIQDYEVDAAFNLRLLKGAALRRLVMICERLIMRSFDRVSTISHYMLNRLLTKGVAPECAVLLPNWVDLSAIRTIKSEANRYRDELKISSDAIVALYSGNMGGKQGLEILAQAASLLCNVSNIVFVFCGNGAGRAELITQCTGLPNVRFLDLQPPEHLEELLSMADIHLLPQRADVADVVMPSKLTGMLASGRPVVATAHQNTELADIVAKCGLVVPPAQPETFSDAIRVLERDAGLRTQLGSAGRTYAEKNFNQETILSEFMSELTRILR